MRKMTDGEYALFLREQFGLTDAEIEKELRTDVQSLLARRVDCAFTSEDEDAYKMRMIRARQQRELARKKHYSRIQIKPR